MSPSSPTPTRDGSWAGGSRRRWPPRWSSTAIEQAIWTRQQDGVLDLKDVVHHTDRGSQYTSIRFSERLAEASIQPSVGAVGSSYDNALAETINGLYKTELIKPGKPWRTIEEVELATAGGSTGSTTAASTNTAATSHRSSWRRPTTLNAGDQPPAEFSNQNSPGRFTLVIERAGAGAGRQSA